MRVSEFTLVVAVAVFTSASNAQQTESFLGKWKGLMTTPGGGELAFELNLSETAGTWHFLPRSGQGRNNPCLGRDFPVVFMSQSAKELKFEVRGAAVVQGCINVTAELNTVDGKHLEGVLSDGRAVKMAR